MGEEVNDDRVLWEVGLPGADDLTPLTLQLIPPELASAFRISPELSKTMNDVNRASQNTFSSLQRWHSQDMSSINNSKYKLFDEEMMTREETVTEKDETDLTREGSDPRKLRRVESGEADSILRDENFVEDDSSAKGVKRTRLVWTPQLHKRFVEVVAHIGIKNAVPKTIMQLMNVEGLTRENVASHLQKYRLYLKRQSNEGPSSPDHVRESDGHVAMQYPPQMVPMPMIGMAPGGYGGGPQMGFHHQYNMAQQQREWSGNIFGYYHTVASNDK